MPAATVSATVPSLWYLCAVLVMVLALLYSVQHKESNTLLRTGQLHRVICHTHSYRTDSPATAQLICGRLLIEQYVDAVTVSHLRYIIDSALSVSGGSSSGVSIYDIASGAVSQQQAFASIYQLYKRNNTQHKPLFNTTHIDTYIRLVQAIQSTIQEQFNQSALYLTKPSFISRITSAPPLTANDEYYHIHVDTQQYGTFLYTALIYLNNHNQHFDGGEFVFVSGAEQRTVEHTVQPSAGSVLIFSSGAENSHYVDRVTDGVRYALTIAFTSDHKHRIDPQYIRQQVELYIE